MSSVKTKASKRKAAAEGSSRAPPKATKKPRKPKGMVELPEGTVLTDLTKKHWRLGKLIGWGGFGALYLASPDDGSAVKDNAAYVVKTEPHTNGPLFTELAFYQRVAKPDLIASWCKSRRLKHLGVPVFWGCGSIEYGSSKLRFLVMERFGMDVDELFVSNGRRFDITTVLMLGLRIYAYIAPEPLIVPEDAKVPTIKLDILEYIHCHEYAHADIKGSNLMMGFSKSNADQVYLLDYGLVYRFNPDGNHKKYKEDPKRKHDGTIEFTSRDAHNGVVPARRCDLEILGYVMLQWLCDRLPWEKNLSSKEYVQNEKIRYMRDIPQLMQDCFNGDHPVEMQKYLQYINTLEYEQEPDYEHLRKLFKDGLKKRGCTDDGRTVKFKSGQANTMSTSDADTLCSSYDAETRNGSSRQKPVVKVKVNDIPVKKYNYRSMLGDMRNVWKSTKRQSEDGNDSSPPRKLRSGPRKDKAKEVEKVPQSDTSKKPRTAGRRRKPVMVDTATSP